MKFGIFSDIHSNLEALEVVLDFYQKNPCDYYACLGDVVGYGAAPNKCCERVRNFVDVAVLGNHDAAVSGRMNYTYYYDAAREALDQHRQWIDDEHMAWLKQLPYLFKHPDEDVLFSHGSPINPEDFDYVFSLEQAYQLSQIYFDKLPHVSFIGHSHLTKAFAIKRDKVEDVSQSEINILDEWKYIITVGSVGQPRDYDNRACCVIYDTEKKKVNYFRHDYDIETSAKKIFDTPLSKNFGKRLFLGI